MIGHAINGCKIAGQPAGNITARFPTAYSYVDA